MKKVFFILMLLVNGTYAQVLVPMNSNSIIIKSTAKTLDSLEVKLFNEGFTLTKEGRMIYTNTIIKNGTYVLFNILVDTVNHELIIKPMLDKSAYVAAYQGAFAGYTTNTKVIVDAKAKPSGAHKKIWAYSLYLFQGLGDSMTFSGGTGKLIKINPASTADAK